MECPHEYCTIFRQEFIVSILNLVALYSSISIVIKEVMNFRMFALVKLTGAKRFINLVDFKRSWGMGLAINFTKDYIK